MQRFTNEGLYFLNRKRTPKKARKIDAWLKNVQGVKHMVQLSCFQRFVPYVSLIDADGRLG